MKLTACALCGAVIEDQDLHARWHTSLGVLLSSIAEARSQFISAVSIDPEVIIRACSELFGVRAVDVTGPDRSRNLVKARHVTMYLVRDMTGLSYPQIARYFDRDHSTVVNAVRNVERSLDLRALAANVRAILTEVPDGPV